MELLTIVIIIAAAVLGLFGFTAFLAMCFRTVVPADEVHVVQDKSGSTVYGNVDVSAQERLGNPEKSNGNVYYSWPAWIPVIGVRVSVLEASNFDLDLKDYLAFDSGKIGFLVDLKAYFQISDFKTAAKRISSHEALVKQLIGMMSGACRSVLAQYDIEKIMADRATFGDDFTKEIELQLKEWGVKPIRNIELMNIEDAPDSTIIETIQKKRESELIKESEVIVAENQRIAMEAKLEAQKKVDIATQEAKRATALNDIQAKLVTEQATADLNQKTAEMSRITTQKQLEVHQYEQIQLANVAKQKLEIEASAKKESDITRAQGVFESEKLQAQALEVRAKAQSEAKKLESEGIEAEGKAQAAAKQANELATVVAQVELQSKLGSNKEYLAHMVNIEQIKADKEVGIEKAKSLSAAKIQIIANASSVDNGINKATDIFSSNGGIQAGAFLEGLKTTETGKKLMALLGPEAEPTDSMKH